MKIGIYGGTFDPVHHAHLILARDALETLGLDKVIFVPAAISPLKKAAPIANSESRLAMVKQVRQNNRDASIYYLIGEDNVGTLTKWHQFAELEKLVRFIILDRTGKSAQHSYPVVERKINISATEIRKRVASGQSIRYLVPPAVEEIIRREKLYLEQSK